MAGQSPIRHTKPAGKKSLEPTRVCQVGEVPHEGYSYSTRSSGGIGGGSERWHSCPRGAEPGSTSGGRVDVRRLAVSRARGIQGGCRPRGGSRPARAWRPRRSRSGAFHSEPTYLQEIGVQHEPKSHQDAHQPFFGPRLGGPPALLRRHDADESESTGSQPEQRHRHAGAVPGDHSSGVRTPLFAIQLKAQL